jgi:hypothetical protein
VFALGSSAGTPENFIARISETIVLEMNMKRFAALLLLSAMSVGAPALAHAQRYNARQQARADRKAERKQQKAQKRYARAQRKAQKKMIKKDKKNTHLPPRQF